VKSTFRLIAGMATLCLSVLLSGCGQPGPLYLPKPPGGKTARSGNTPATPPTIPPVPSPISDPVAPQQ
jgi:predicted small lipoprotein YifL